MLRAERDRLRDALGRVGAGAVIDEDLARAVVRMGAIGRDPTGPPLHRPPDGKSGGYH